MAEQVIKSIPLENLLIDLKNPRYDPRTSQPEAITTIVNDQGMKLAKLAKDIAERGLNPAELPIVEPTDGGKFIVLEGNRRIAALKLIASPSLATSIGLPESVVEQYKLLSKQFQPVVPQQVDCAVFPSRKDASHWIFLRHTGENQGIGIVPWDGLQTQRFRGSSLALQALEKSSDYLDEATKEKLPKISITNIQRILNTPAARKHLGVDVENGRLVLREPEEAAKARLALVVSDVANRHVKVSDLDTKEQRAEYAEQVAQRPLPVVAKASSTSKTATELVPTPSEEPPSPKRIPPDRKTLVPTRFRLAIPQPRINRIYHELQKLNVDQFVNCCAVMFRVFVELSLDHFAQQHAISFKKAKDKEMTLREKLQAIANHMESNSICTKAELRGIRTLVANREHVLSVDSLNAYVHNRDYSPTPTDLKISWDNLQVFIEHIWTI